MPKKRKWDSERRVILENACRRRQECVHTVLMEVQLALGGIVLGIFALLCGITCCVVRCFRPEGSRGPKWIVDPATGADRVVAKPFGRGDGKSWLLNAENEKAVAGAGAGAGAGVVSGA